MALQRQKVPATQAPAVTEPPAPTEAPAPTFSGTATITFVQEPDNLNPMYTTMSFSGYLRPFYLKPSWDFDENAKPVPVLVTEIPTVENGGLSADGKTITLKLRDDVKWSDGEPLTADDFVFTLRHDHVGLRTLPWAAIRMTIMLTVWRPRIPQQL